MEEYINVAVEFLSSAVSNIDVYVIAASAIVAALVAVSKITKNKTDDKYVAKLVALLDKIKSFLPSKKKVTK